MPGTVGLILLAALTVVTAFVIWYKIVIINHVDKQVQEAEKSNKNKANVSN